MHVLIKGLVFDIDGTSLLTIDRSPINRFDLNIVYSKKSSGCCIKLDIALSINFLFHTVIISVLTKVYRNDVSVPCFSPLASSDGETIVRTATDCWVVGKKSDQREFYVVLNQKNANIIEINGRFQEKKSCVTYWWRCIIG